MSAGSPHPTPPQLDNLRYLKPKSYPRMTACSYQAPALYDISSRWPIFLHAGETSCPTSSPGALLNNREQQLGAV